MGIRILHHNDMDGRCAAAIALRYYTSGNVINFIGGKDLKDIELEEVDYNSQPQNLSKYFGHDVVVLDFSLSRDKMIDLSNIANSLVWIDHHKTAIEKMEGVDLPGKRSVDYAGCVLTYMYYYNLDSIDDIPYAILLVGDRDTWKFQYGDDTRHFFTGFYYTEDSTPSSAAWDIAISKSISYIEKGAELKVVIDKIYGDQVEKSGFWVDWEGYHCFCVNSASPGSEALERSQPTADIYISFRWAQGMFSVSLYTTKPGINVSEIAKKYRWNGIDGGGHVGAAGFQCSFPPFLLWKR